MARQRTYDNLIRVRVKNDLRDRVVRVADRRGCDESDVTREAIINFVQSEEIRLGIAPAEPANAR